ncbi:MAG: galactokinase [Anaerolineae bacterium]|nr:galactokinase [Anaerolineae bacterium]MDW8100696.1 galactokinase [Anaerolineae bacterium]
MDADWGARLAEIYGAEAVASQWARYRSALALFRAAYGPGPVVVCRCPGRVNLIGEHTDYNQGFCLPTSLDRDLLVLARPRRDQVVSLINSEPDLFPPRRFALSESIPSGPAGDWGNYGRGAGQKLWRTFGPLRGFDGLIVGQAPHGVPRGAGVSSSTALTVALAIALAYINGLEVPLDQFAQLCSEAEWYVGTRGGVLDQFATLLGRQGHALFLDCQPRVSPNGIRTFCTEPVPLLDGYALILADSRVRHRHTTGGYNVRVAEGRLGAACLAVHFSGVRTLRDVQMQPWDVLAPHLPEVTTLDELTAMGMDTGRWLGDLQVPKDMPLKLRARCRHVHSENRRVLSSVAAWRQGDARAVGELLNQAHVSLRDDYEVSCPEIEVLRELILAVDGVLGARLVGGGWGGCVVALAEAGCEEAFIKHVAPAYERATGLSPEIFVCRTSAGAGVVTVIEC